MVGAHYRKICQPPKPKTQHHQFNTQLLPFTSCPPKISQKRKRCSFWAFLILIYFVQPNNIKTNRHHLKRPALYLQRDIFDYIGTYWILLGSNGIHCIGKGNFGYLSTGRSNNLRHMDYRWINLVLSKPNQTQSNRTKLNQENIARIAKLPYG